MKEEWKPIPGYEGIYEASRLGRIRSLGRIIACKDGRRYFKPGRLLKLNNRLYKTVQLGDKNVYVHRIVALTFIPNTQNLPCVNHKDENKHNNRVDNLEWCTQRYNVTYGKAQEKCSKSYFHPKRIVEQRAIDGGLINTFSSLGEASRCTGIRGSHISECCANSAGHFTAGGYRWNYKNMCDV